MVSCLRKRKHLDNIVCGKSAFRAAKIPKLEGKIGRKLKPANSHIQRFSKNLPDDTIGSMLLLSDESTSLCSSTTGPKNKLPGRISPVALPGCANLLFKTDKNENNNIFIMASGYGPTLTNLFAERLKTAILLKLASDPDFDFLINIDTFIKSYLQNSYPDNQYDIGVVLIYNYEVVVICHNSPCFPCLLLFFDEKMDKFSEKILISKCKNRKEPVAVVHRIKLT